MKARYLHKSVKRGQICTIGRSNTKVATRDQSCCGEAYSGQNDYLREYKE